VVHVPELATNDDITPGAHVDGIPIANRTVREVMADATVLRQEPVTGADHPARGRGPAP